VLLHGIQTVSVSQTLRRLARGTTCIRQGGHHVGISPHSSFYSSKNYFTISRKEYRALEMWANAQRDGHAAEYRWRPLFNAAKFG